VETYSSKQAYLSNLAEESEDIGVVRHGANIMDIHLLLGVVPKQKVFLYFTVEDFVVLKCATHIHLLP